MELTRSERWILACQYRILEGLYPEEAGEFRKVREALERGDAALIAALAPLIDIDEPLLNEEERSLVERALSLFDALQHSQQQLEELEEPSGIDEPGELIFPGFDRETESELAAYARMLLAETGRFAHVEATEALGDARPMVPAYRRMLETWRIYAESRDLTIVQILYILEAANESTHEG